MPFVWNKDGVILAAGKILAMIVAELMTVCSFPLKDCEDPNPLIRALAVRTMGCIRVDKITEYLCEPLRKCLKDEDPYVRKTAAVCVAKLHDINAQMVEDQGFLDSLRDLIADSNPMVMYISWQCTAWTGNRQAIRNVKASNCSWCVVRNALIRECFLLEKIGDARLGFCLFCLSWVLQQKFNLWSDDSEEQGEKYFFWCSYRGYSS